MATQNSTLSTSTLTQPVATTSNSQTSKSQNQSGSMRRPSAPFTKSTGTPTKGTSNLQSRNAKRARWAKKSRPVAKPSIQRGPEFEYLCVCHNEAARKPRAGQKDVIKDPESGKMKDKPKGLGKWRCAVTNKIAKVSPRKPAPKVVKVDMSAVEHSVISSLTEVPIVAA